LLPRREDELMSQLAYARRLELEAREPAARSASLAGISLVLQGAAALTGREARASDLSFPLGGKPQFAGQGPGFSISHCECLVVAAVSMDIDPGIDVEPAAADARARARLARWVATEAILKAAGAELRAAGEVRLDEDARAGVLRGQRFRVFDLALGPGVIAALASREPVAQIEYRAVTLDDPGSAGTRVSR
jgi:phosphopantetheinyl transferase